jgi:hypothetical protein
VEKGSITVFLSLVLVLVLSFIFALLEGARVFYLKGKAEIVTDLCLQSMFGNYHEGVWQDYHLLFIDGTWGRDEFSKEVFAFRAMDEIEANMSRSNGQVGSPSWDLTKLQASEFEMSGYELAADDGGEVFQSQVARQMKMEAAVDALDEILSLQELKQDTEDKKQDAEEKWSKAWNALEQAQEEQEQETEGNSVDDEKQETEGNNVDDKKQEQSGHKEISESLENPMEYVKQLRRNAVLGLVVKDAAGLSEKTIKSMIPLKDRKLSSGSLKTERENAVSGRLWLQYFIQNYFSNYLAESKKGPSEKILNYEMEYMIGGKLSDRENLEMVVYELLGIREALNFTTIMGDAAKKTLALEIATAAVGFTGILPLIKAVQIGILLSWAFVESVLDIRSLLEGKKVPFLKRTDQWASDLSDSRGTIESGQMSDNDGEGMDYTQYLQLMLLLLSSETINYRCMDLIGQNEQVDMEHMIYAAEGTVYYQASPLFWSLIMVKRQEIKDYSFSVRNIMAYGK